jgi:voltage-gated potassium channel
MPLFVSFLFPGTQSLLVIRAIRLLRVFRMFKLGHYLGEARVLSSALRASKNKSTVFLGVDRRAHRNRHDK